MLNLFQHPWCGNHRSMPIERNPCVYIVASQPRGTLYIGVTSDLMQRLAQHRSGETGGFTSRYGVFRLVRFEMFGDMEAAILREKQLKRWRRQWKINLIEGDNPQWLDLGVNLGFDPIKPSDTRDGS
nr:GIY-YIG nuclease family protein [Erythrobacter litoralis]